MERLWRSIAGDWRKTAVLAVSLVLTVLIAVTLARLVWLVIEGPPSDESAAGAVAVAPVVPVARPRFTPEMALDWRLFGDATANAPALSDSENAPATNLSLQLLGIFSTGDAKLAGAVIAERGKDGELYRIGASLPGGAVLEKVEAEKVLLRRRGQLETLAFDAAGSSMGGANMQGVASANGGVDIAGGFAGLKDRLMQPPDGDDGSEAGDAQSRARTVLGNLANDLRSNPDGVLTELGLKAVSANQSSGYLVAEGASADAMRSLGLRPGDIVLSVNGKPLGNVRNDTRLVDEVKASGEARVEIRRGSQTFTVNYPL